MRFIATCKMGVESLTSLELKKLGINVLAVEDARVIFEGGFDEMAAACLWLRTAERVLLEVSVFNATTFEELFEGVKRIDWRQYLRRDSFIHVTGKSAKSTLFSVSDCQSIAKKAIVESLRSSCHTQILPETGNRVIIEIGLLRDVVTVALDCCGAGLSRRGYRTYNVDAPIAETLGAAIVMLSRYKPDIPLYDPMCGSGTMPIEAAMIAANIAPGLNRTFAAESWHFLETFRFRIAREAARDSIKPQASLPPIYGSDIDARCIDLCKRHAKKAGVMLNWAVKPLSEFSPVHDGFGIIACNPPYGERLMDKKHVEKLYKEMHAKFEAHPNLSRNIITSNPDFEKVYGKADKRRNLTNGGMRCTLYSYFAKKDL